MDSLLRTIRFAEWGSAALVIVAAMIVGRYAAIGMDTRQWACGLVAVAGSVLVAVLVHTAPQRAEEQR